MPDICTNHLTVAGDKELLGNFEKAVAGYDDQGNPLKLCFNSLVPLPAGFSPDPGERNAWRTANWGTKWEAMDEIGFRRDNEGLHYDFDTAWDPPIGWLESASAKFPDLTLTLAFIDEEADEERRETVFQAGSIIEGYSPDDD